MLKEKDEDLKQVQSEYDAVMSERQVRHLILLILSLLYYVFIYLFICLVENCGPG